MNSIATQWQETHAYSLGQEIMDSLAHYHIQRVTTGGHLRRNCTRGLESRGQHDN